jgi:hypothetical protein
MRHNNRWAWVVAACFCGTAAAAEESSLAVFFTVAKVEERKEVDDATKKALRAKRDAAREARRALEKQLKDQLGKKRESWPPEKDEELYRAEEVEALADADYEYRKVDLEAMADGLKDLRRAAEGKGLQAGKKDHITLAGSAGEADLVVEVLGRRVDKQVGAKYCHLLFSIGPGSRMSPQSFAKVPADYRVKKWSLTAWKIASPTPERPVFVFEGRSGSGTELGCHGAAANAASTVVDMFIGDNHPRLTGP